MSKKFKKTNGPRLAIDFRSLWLPITPRIYPNELMEMYEESGILFYSSVDEDGNPTEKPFAIDGEIDEACVVDVTTKEGRELFLKNRKNEQ